ncbi:hypothetical protein MJO29_000855 [Puccinia striiformis f. sp. tritici]|uniref:hypothetical protein n=1 Tax=Puccinia striiformis f. sp. tritici TaxID=168172 RepID=UPI002007E69E|nr:hypothetical protein Pst134EA_000863 [Puccinia striiformis f. sp. tritici]KAH9473798.1 hypothetical protein Pst134EA_000863 [Puccinia striiformis f. sp. tritici]KAI7967578.1 hypothetical protein MJO29_000855 [Puccinia striiformis f. sp. tritici]KAI9600146.1 hypothetical protein KEM48_000560 [Puccinia striiformis f. sp. tritici PST-130]
MRGLQICKIVFGILVSFHHSIAADAPPSVGIPSSVSPCGAVPLEITGGTPPYSIAINTADNPSGPPLHTFADVKQPSSLAWPSGMSTGMVLTMEVKDSKGLTTTSGQSTVIPSADCPQSPGAGATKNTTDIATTGPSGGDGAAKNWTQGMPALSSDKTAGGPTPPASANSTDPAHPANAFSTTANATGAVRLDSADSSNASMPDSANVTATADQHGVMNMTDSTPMSPSTARTTNMPPSNKTVSNNDNSKSGNNTSSVNNRPNPARSEASRRQLGPLYLSLFITTLAGILINR